MPIFLVLWLFCISGYSTGVLGQGRVFESAEKAYEYVQNNMNIDGYDGDYAWGKAKRDPRVEKYIESIKQDAPGKWSDEYLTFMAKIKKSFECYKDPTCNTIKRIPDTGFQGVHCHDFAWRDLNPEDIAGRLQPVDPSHPLFNNGHVNPDRALQALRVGHVWNGYVEADTIHDLIKGDIIVYYSEDRNHADHSAVFLGKVGNKLRAISKDTGDSVFRHDVGWNVKRGDDYLAYRYCNDCFSAGYSGGWRTVYS